MCVFYIENNCEVTNDQINAEFRELFDQLSSETEIDDNIDFDIEAATSLPAIVPLTVDWRQETRNKSITEVMEPEIIEDQHENRKITAAEALKKLDEVKYVMEYGL